MIYAYKAKARVNGAIGAFEYKTIYLKIDDAADVIKAFSDMGFETAGGLSTLLLTTGTDVTPKEYQEYFDLLDQAWEINNKIKNIENRQLARYESPRPEDEPHDTQCQRTRYGENHCCTCESNRTRRKAALKASAVADNRIVYNSLSSHESANWRDYRGEAVRKGTSCQD